MSSKIGKLVKITLFMMMFLCFISFIACQSNAGIAVEKDKTILTNPTVEPEGTKESNPITNLNMKSEFEKVDVEKNIEYRQVENYKGINETLHLDLYQPAGDNENNRPVLILVHGGGMVSGSKDEVNLVQLATDFAKKGYVTLSVDYRLRSDQSKYLEAMDNASDDVAASVSWLLANREKYKIDSKHITLVGHSVGSDIVSNLCYNDQKAGKWNEESICATVVIAGGGLPQKELNAKPQKNDPPCLIFQGTLDEYNQYSNAENFAEILKKNEISSTLHPLKDGQHDFKDDFYEVEDVTAQFLYKEITGKDALINIRTNKQLAMEKIKRRLTSNKIYKAKQINFKADGNLDEWGDSEKLPFDQLVEGTKSLPVKTDFSGSSMIGWNEKDPTRIYLAATITDSVITNNVPADGWWRADDAIVFYTDLTEDAVLSPLLWAIGATGDLSEIATKDCTECKIVKKGSTSTYEIAIDLSKAIPKSSELRTTINNYKCSIGKTIGIDAFYEDIEKNYSLIGWVPGPADDRLSYVNVTFDAAYID